MYNGQLELSLGSRVSCRALPRRQRRLTRAHWWFDRMRQVVERAVERQPSRPARPQQTWLPGTHRGIDNIRSEALEHQVCE
jgi:hypothetical protein